MGRQIHPRICGNCKYCQLLDDTRDSCSNIEHAAYDMEETGYCSKHGDEIVFLDNDDGCKDYHSLKRPRIREEDW